MKKIAVILLVFFSLISCKKDQNDIGQTIDVNNQYSLTIPSYLTKTTILNNEASLQYMNGVKEFYVAVIDVPIDEFQETLVENDLEEDYKNDLQGYTDLLFETFKNAINATKVSDVKETTINGMPARIYSMNANVDGYGVYYQIAYVQGKKDYYQVLTWTLEAKENHFKDIMQNIIASLKEK